MKEKWVLIKEWIGMSTLNQLKIVLASVILFQTSSLIFFISTILTMQREHANEIKELNKENYNCWQSHIIYIEKNKVEFDDIKEQLDKLKRYENNNNDTLYVSNRR